ncbi:MAG: redoxin domain-containing protein, partial [Gemmatimonadaceae bacterium]|nr:redoxin domain-containing protein [Gemmatimonadaceae bacterium]
MTNLQVGQTVPDFKLDTYLPTKKDFGDFSLAANMAAGKWTVLVFYPADFTFVCATEFSSLAELYPQFQKLGAEVVTVSTDTKFTHLAWQEHEGELKGVTYPMGADPTARVSKLFGVYLEDAGVDLRDVDVERIRAAYRDGATVLVPCHRSHLDYVLISSQLFERDVMIPHVVAGENLSFFPLGPLLRRVGAVFIKRSFSGDRVFPAVFSAYLRQLIRDEFPLEFFIEGGRSRTGKLLPPKLGVLSMVMDAAAEARADRRVTLLPVAISYEQIAEEGAYARELDGGRKQAEDLGQVVKAGKVVTKRYGRVFMRVGQPILAGEVLGGLPRPWAELGRE